MPGNMVLKLDAQGIPPDALMSILNKRYDEVMQQPGVIALTTRRLERLRRLKDELRYPLSHLKIKSPQKGKPGAEPPIDDMSQMMQMTQPMLSPTSPGLPPPPSNMLGLFSSPQGMPAGGQSVPEMPKAAAVDTDSRRMAFKLGFFTKLAECGVTPSEFMKAAVTVAPSALYGASETAKNVGGLGKWTAEKAWDVGKIGLTVPLALALLTGALGGASYRMLSAPSYEEPAELRDIERVALYKRLAREAQHRAQRLKGKRDSAEQRQLPAPEVAA